MAGTSERRFLRLVASVLLCGACVVPASHAHAQAPAPTPQPPATSESPPEPPREVTSADFALQASAVEERLVQIRSDLSVADITESVNRALDEIEAEGAELESQFDALEARRMMISELNSLDVQLHLLDTRTEKQFQKLRAYTAELEKVATRAREDTEVWTTALRMIRGSSVPKAARDRTRSILHGLREGRAILDKKINEVLSLQSRALDVRDRVHAAERAVTFAQKEQADAIFRRQDPPFWSADAMSESDAEREGYDIRFSWAATSSYLKEERSGLAAQLILTLLLGWLLSRSRALVSARIAKRQQGGGPPWEDQAAEALLHPWAASLLVVLACFRFFYPDRVVEVILLTWVVALPLWFVVVKGMLPAAFRGPLIGLALLGTVHIVVTLVSGQPLAERLLLVFELALTGAGAAWTVRYLRDAEVPKRIRQGLWFSLANLGVRLVVMLSLGGGWRRLSGTPTSVGKSRRPSSSGRSQLRCAWRSHGSLRRLWRAPCTQVDSMPSAWSGQTGT